MKKTGKNNLLSAWAVVWILLGLSLPLSVRAADDTTSWATARTTMFSRQAADTVRATDAVFDRLAFVNVSPPARKRGASAASRNTGAYNLWLSPFYAYTRDKNASTGYKGDTYGGFLGGDYVFNKSWAAGLMLGIDKTHLDSKVNGGGADAVTFTVAPYLRYAFSKTYSADVAFGFSSVDTDNDRLASGALVTGTSKTDRWFGALGANASYWQERWNFLFRAGTILSRDKRDAFTETDGTLVADEKASFGQAQLGGTLGYYFQHIRPWLSTFYTYDYSRKLPEVGLGQAEPDDGRSAVVLGLGTTVFGYGMFSGDLSVKQAFFKKNYDDVTVNLAINAAF